jgi:hypothetical protein
MKSDSSIPPRSAPHRWCTGKPGWALPVKYMCSSVDGCAILHEVWSQTTHRTVHKPKWRKRHEKPINMIHTRRNSKSNCNPSTTMLNL